LDYKWVGTYMICIILKTLVEHDNDVFGCVVAHMAYETMDM